MVTDDPYPIYMEECYCEKGHFDHSGYSGGYGHSKDGREGECYMCPYKKLAPWEKKAYLKVCKAEAKTWKEYEKAEREWIKNHKDEDDLPLPF